MGGTIFGVEIDAVTEGEVVARCQEAIASRDPLVIGVVNAAKVVRLRRDQVIRDSILDSDLVLADGQSVVWASRVLRRPLPERVTGIDLFEDLLEVADRRGQSVYLLGARPEVLDRMRARLAWSHPGVRVVGWHDGYFHDDQSDAIARDVRASRADLLFLGMTSPKKERFIETYGRHLDVPVVHGVGGSFDIFAGEVTRAPERWQRAGLEWAYRLLQEPRRMWRRYLGTNTAFLGLLAKEIVHPTKPYTHSEVGREAA